MNVTTLVERLRPSMVSYEGTYQQLSEHVLEDDYPAITRVLGSFLYTMGYTVRENIDGRGLVAQFKNGAGPKVMLWSAMTAYFGLLEHDLGGRLTHGYPTEHLVTCLLAAAQLLIAAKTYWSGTLLLYWQPDRENHHDFAEVSAEEIYRKFPQVNVLLGQHSPWSEHRQPTLRPQYTNSPGDYIRIEIIGTTDQHHSKPMITACHIVAAIEDFILDELPRIGYGRVQCQEIRHGRDDSNSVITATIFLDTVVLREHVKTQLFIAIQRIVHSECQLALTELQARMLSTPKCPRTFQDSFWMEKLTENFNNHFMLETDDTSPQVAHDNVARAAQPMRKPYVYWWIGKECQEGECVCGIDDEDRSFVEDIAPDLAQGVDALAVAALTFLMPRAR